jgi:8-oxo-dGTP pyrophosphatase MutT (NUDIX family)
MIQALKVVIRDGDKVLFLQRSAINPVCPLRWDLPGGRRKRGEPRMNCLTREVWEETKFRLKPSPEPIGRYHGEVAPGRNAEFLLYDEISHEGELQLDPKEHVRAMYEEPRKMRGLLSMPFMEQFIEDFYRR